MINWINDNMDRHIITIEDPIEYYHKHKKSLVNQREIGIDVPDFPEAIRRALRMDPDIILVGEMRDLATIQAAITAAETGHIVFGTLHTNSAEGTVNRIIDVFPKEQQDQIRTQLSVAIIGILAQALLPRKPKGLVAAYEMLVVTPAISNLIRENKTYRIDSSIQTGRKHGMILLDDSLFNLWRQGLVRGGRGHRQVAQAQRPPRADRERQEGDLRGRAGRGRGGRAEGPQERCPSRVTRSADSAVAIVDLAVVGLRWPIFRTGVAGRVAGRGLHRGQFAVDGDLACPDSDMSGPGSPSTDSAPIRRRPQPVSTELGVSARGPRGRDRRGWLVMARRLGTDPGGHGLPRRGDALEGPRGAEAVGQRAARQGGGPARPGQRGPGARRRWASSSA